MRIIKVMALVSLLFSSGHIFAESPVGDLVGRVVVTTHEKDSKNVTADEKNIISAENPDAILKIASGFGSATLKKDTQGDPLISGRIDGNKYGIVFQSCDSSHKCDDILFASAWGGSGVAVSIDDIHRWNSEKKFGKAYLDKDGDPVLDMAVNLEHGVTIENFEDTFDYWVKALKQFKTDVLKQ